MMGIYRSADRPKHYPANAIVQRSLNMTDFFKLTFGAVAILLAFGAASQTTSKAPSQKTSSISGGGGDGGGSSTPTYISSYEQGNLIRAGQVVQALGPDLMGDKVNEYTGTLQFEQTDASLPGNNGLAVMAGRLLSTASKQPTLALGQFGDWELAIPHLQTVAGGSYGEPGQELVANQWFGFDAAHSYELNRCTHMTFPPMTQGYTGGTLSPVAPSAWWDGYHMVIPGSGTQTLLGRDAATTPVIQPNDGAGYPILTKEHWQLSCLSSLVNDAGEGFVAHAPDGTSYQFDHMARRGYPTYQGLSDGTQVTAGRTEIWIMPTRISDRFGNYVTYNYDASDAWKLLSIVASDGRTISFTYVSGTHRIQTVFDGTRTWTYAYDGNGYLRSVTLPDGSTWQFALGPLEHAAPPGANDPGCSNGSFDQIDPNSYTGTLTHPSGATGSFTHQMLWHATSNVPGSPDGCSGQNYYVNGIPYHNTVPIYSSSYTLTAKTLSGPGMPAMTWLYAYSAPVGNFAPPSGTAVVTKTVSITDPLGNVTSNTYGTQYGLTEGLLLSSAVGVSGSNALRTTTYTYAAPADGPYPRSVGSFSSSGEAMSTVYTPQKQRVITQQAVVFAQTLSGSGFDIYARPTSIDASSSLGYSRTIATTYWDDLKLWVLGQIASQTVSSQTTAGVVASSTNFDGLALPTASYKFGQFQASYVFNGDGTLASVTNGRGLQTAFSNYKRGLAQNIVYPDHTSISAVVNNIGTIDSVTNEVNTMWSFSYDAMGRIASATAPTGDSVGYNTKTYSFVQVNTPEAGLEAGHWRQTIAEGNAVTVNYFDARWRKRLSSTYDAASPDTPKRVQSFTYDPYNRTTFAAYPARNIGSVSDTVAGTSTAYDALGRSYQSRADSELGVLTTNTQYIDNFQKRVTNARGMVTTTAYQAFDEPIMDSITSISAPEGVSVNIQRNVFGKSTSVTRSGSFAGANLSVTRNYVYDGYQRLCKTVEPEIGATIQDYDGANNVAWRATGLSLTASNDCNRGDVH